MRKRSLRRAFGLAAVLAVLACGSAWGLTAEIGNDYVSATATLRPRVLPGHGGAPLTLSSITRIGTRDHSVPAPLKTLQFLFDKHGYVDAKGVPVCTMTKLEDTTPAVARKRCAGALIGKGVGKGIVTMPGQSPVAVSSPLSFFNGPPKGGLPTIIVHAYETIPAPKTLLVPIAIERIKHGRYGYRARIEVPPIAEGYGSATLATGKIDLVHKQHGREVGYLNAYCAGGRLQVYGTLAFVNGNFFPAVLASPCHTPH